VEFGAELDRCGTAADDDKVEKAASLGLCCRGAAGALETLDDPLSNVAGVGHRLEEVAVLLNAGHSVAEKGVNNKGKGSRPLG
jgi:hypothetical protein